MRYHGQKPSYLVSIYLAQRGLCFHCAKPMLMTPAGNIRRKKRDDGWTREHIVPRSKGGKNAENIVLAHARCNNKRGDVDPTPEMLERAQEVWAAAKRITPHQAKQAVEQTIDLDKPWIHIYRFYPHEGEPKFPPKKHA